MKCIVVTPEKTVFEKESSFIALPLFDGEYGIGNDHTPLVGRLGAGELRLTNLDGSVESWYLEGGFVEVLQNVVTCLTNVAFPVQQLEREKAQKAFDVAVNRPNHTPELGAMREKAVQAARAQLRLVQKYSL